MTDFVKFTEHNDWEGEDWHFFLQVDGNTNELAEFLVRLDGMAESYELDMTELIPESEVDVLVKHSPWGYMNTFNRVSGKVNLPDINDEDLFDRLYKGGIMEMFA